MKENCEANGKDRSTSSTPRHMVRSPSKMMTEQKQVWERNHTHLQLGYTKDSQIQNWFVQLSLSHSIFNKEALKLNKF
jgi:hypothetical protein